MVGGNIWISCSVKIHLETSANAVEESFEIYPSKMHGNRVF